MNSLIIYLGNVCNNNCSICTTASSLKTLQERSLIEEKIKKNRNNFNNIHFTGGEPAIHPAIISFVEESKVNNYFNISMGTNARKFSDANFTKNIVYAGLNSVNVTVYGPEKIHNRITQKKSYKETISGIKNLQKNSAEVIINFVLLKNNIDYLNETFEMFFSIGIKKIVIQDLLVEKNYNELKAIKLMTSYKSKFKFFNKNKKIIEKFEKITILNFPRCVLPSIISEKFIYVSDYEKNKWKFDGLDSLEKNFLYQKLAICKNCPNEGKCLGFKKENIKKFGLDIV